MQEQLIDILQLNENKLASITEFLEIITKNSGAYGTILWELNKKTQHLYIVAHWFPQNQQPAFHAVPVNESKTGIAIAENERKYVPNIKNDPHYFKPTTFWDDFKIKSFITIPIQYKDGVKGALVLYANKINPFTIKKQKELATIASILPNWFQSLRDKATYSLIKNIDNLLKEAENALIDKPISPDSMGIFFQKICRIVSRAFQTFETSIFLKNPLDVTIDYQCLATTWKNSKSKLSYQADITNGLTGWILYNKKSVKINDLLQFEEHKKIIQKEYPKLTWNARGNIKDAVARKLKIDINKGQQLPPMGFMGCPIMFGNDIYGVIRCCAPLANPYYLGTFELGMLQLVATRIGEMWSSWLQRNLIYEDSRAWENILKAMNSLDSFVLTELATKQPDIINIFEKALEKLSNIIRDADILDVRLYDSDNQDLYFAAIYGKEWNLGSDAEINIRKEKRFSVTNNIPDSAGEIVFKSRKAIEMNLLPGFNNDYPYDKTFDNAVRMILSPLIIGNTVLGVLDVRSTKEREFQRTALHVIELMSGQLAVYYELVKKVKELRDLQIQQVQTFQDFAHQFRSPVYQASVRSRLALRELDNKYNVVSVPLIKNLQATSGLCNKANRVAKNMWLFSDLAKNVPIKPNLVRVNTSEITKLLIETASDNKVMVNPNRNIDIQVERGSFNIIDYYYLNLDMDLFEQSINVLLDNAVKYSYAGTVITIYGSLSKRNNFQIIVKNKGIPIKKEEATLCKRRGWRSKLASLTTGEGGGIGLWVVDNIMKAHGGDLVVGETDSTGFNEIKLIFSAPKKI